MSTASVINKPGLFDVDFFLQPKINKNTYLGFLDNKIGDFALKAIGSCAITLGITVCVGAAVFSGIGFIPIVVAVSLIGVGLISIYATSHFKRYHKKELLDGYRTDARELCKSYLLLDKVHFIKQEEAKKHVLRPITALIAKHERLATIFFHKILQVDEFKKAFDLEIKYLSFPKAFAFYEQVVEAAREVPSFAPSLDQIVPTKEEWRRKFQDYLEIQLRLFDPSQPLDYDGIRRLDQTMQQIIDVMNRLFEYQILPPSSKGLFNDAVKKKYLEEREIYLDLMIEHGDCITILENIKQLLDRKYQSHFLHEILFKEQQNFLKGIRTIQAEEEKKLKNLKEEYEVVFASIDARAPLDIEDKQLKAQHQEKYQHDKLKIEEECKRTLNEYMQATTFSDFVDIKQSLADYRESLNESYRKTLLMQETTLERQKEAFIKEQGETLRAFKTTLIGISGVLALIDPKST